MGSLLNSVTGNVDQAILAIDIDMGVIEKPDGDPPNILTMAKRVHQKAMEMAALASNMLDVGSGGNLKENQDCDRFYFFVQYNPSELSMNGEKVVDQYVDLEKKSGNAQVEVPSNVGNNELEFKLVFDEMTISDAFTSESMLSATTLQPTGMVKGMIGTLTKAKSVKKYVDAFVACIGNHCVQKVIFTWSSFMFVGLFARLSVEYTMFDKYGNPIRAEVGIVLKQLDDVLDWNEELDDEFQKSFGLLSNVQGAVGNVLNFNL